MMQLSCDDDTWRGLPEQLHHVSVLSLGQRVRVGQDVGMHNSIIPPTRSVEHCIRSSTTRTISAMCTLLLIHARRLGCTKQNDNQEYAAARTITEWVTIWIMVLSYALPRCRL